MRDPRPDPTHDDLRNKSAVCEVLHSFVIHAVVVWDITQCYVTGTTPCWRPQCGTGDRELSCLAL
jgi:hypothetical protein